MNSLYQMKSSNKDETKKKLSKLDEKLLKEVKQTKGDNGEDEVVGEGDNCEDEVANEGNDGEDEVVVVAANIYVAKRRHIPNLKYFKKIRRITTNIVV